MPLLRKIIKVGNSKAVIIPNDWLDYYKSKYGKDIVEIYMEVNNIITIAVPESFTDQPENDGKDK